MIEHGQVAASTLACLAAQPLCTAVIDAAGEARRSTVQSALPLHADCAPSAVSCVTSRTGVASWAAGSLDAAQLVIAARLLGAAGLTARATSVTMLRVRELGLG